MSSTPRWAKVGGGIAIVLALLFVIMHGVRGGFRHQMPGGHTPPSADTQQGAQKP
jgi:hypothetical protein